MRNSMMRFHFFIFERKYSFWANLVQIIKIVILYWNLVPRLIQICRIQWCYSLFFCFRAQMAFFGKFCPKNQNCHFMLKFGTYTNSSMQKSMKLFSFFFFFQWEYSFWANLVQNIRIVTLCWNLLPILILACRIQ